MRKFTYDEFVHKAKEVHGNFYDYSKVEYITIKRKVNIICPEHGEFEQTPMVHLQGKGCPKCGFIRTHNLGKKEHPYLVFLGVGINDLVLDKNKKCLHTWQNLIRRCYNREIQNKQPMYVGCSVCDEWLTYSNFKAWFENPENGYRDGYELDKDIIVKGNKIYSPGNCCFVPKEINCMFGFNSNKKSGLPTGIFRRENGKYCASIGYGGKSYKLGSFKKIEEAQFAYKTAKEKYVKEQAARYYMDGLITKRVYNALMSYTVDFK